MGGGGDFQGDAVNLESLVMNYGIKTHESLLYMRSQTSEIWGKLDHLPVDLMVLSNLFAQSTFFFVYVI